MEQISSENNQRVRRLAALGTQAKARRQAQSFIIEGCRLVEDAPEDSVQELYVSESFLRELEQNGSERIRRLLEEHPSYVLKDSVFRKAANTETPQGILAVAREPVWSLADLLHPQEEGAAPRAQQSRAGGNNRSARKAGDAVVDRPPLLLLLENIQDPGNLGTMFRTAEAAGATGIVMTRGCVDLFNPKTVRATMSSIFRVPFCLTEDPSGLMTQLEERGVRTYAAYLSGSCPYDEPDYRSGTAFLIGNEGNGLRQETAEAAQERIRIPMEGCIESLNAAMSAGILLYEAHRQRYGTVLNH